MFKHCHINSDSFAYGTRKMVSSAMYLLAVFLVIFSAAAEVPRLRDLAVKRGIFVGSAAGARWISSTDDKYNTTLKEQFSLVTPENACKWYKRTCRYSIIFPWSCLIGKQLNLSKENSISQTVISSTTLQCRLISLSEVTTCAGECTTRTGTAWLG